MIGSKLPLDTSDRVLGLFLVCFLIGCVGVVFMVAWAADNWAIRAYAILIAIFGAGGAVMISRDVITGRFQ